jgi:hypothetical protein
MLFYAVSGGQGKQFYDGEFSPYPRDLGTLILTSARIPEGLCVKAVRGGRIGDMMFAGFNVVSRRFIEVLHECGATGYDAHPIRVVLAHRANQECDGYFLVKLLGRAVIDAKRSGLRYFATGTLSGWNGLYIDEATWDGTDVFAVGTQKDKCGTQMYVVQRLATALRQAKLRNVKITPNTEWSCA